jgi:hypothetical protein
MLTLLVPANLTAQVVSSRGAATIGFGPDVCGTPQGVGRDRRPIPACLQPGVAELREVQRRAAIAAVERFVAENGEAAAQAFERVRDSVSTQFDAIVLNVFELTRAVDSTSRQVSMSVRVDINEARLRNLLAATSAVGSAAQGEKALMGLFMLAREQAEVERFGAEVRVAARTSDSTTLSQRGDTLRAVREAEVLSATAVALSDSVARRTSGVTTRDQSASVSASTSAVVRSDRISFTVAPAQDLDAVLGGRLSAAGFETVEAAFLDDDQDPGLVASVRTDFGAGDDLSAATLRRMVAAAQREEVRYALVGTVDLGMAFRDDVSGAMMVYAKVSAKVYDLSGRLPRTVVNVGPAQFSGLGPDASVAKVNALKSAAEATATIILDQLSNRQVR